jgi:DoxX
MELAFLVVRVIVGLLFIGHGSQKLFGVFGGSGLRGTADMFDAISLRPGHLHARAAGATEVVGGCLVVLGLVTPVGAALVIVMILEQQRRLRVQRGDSRDRLRSRGRGARRMVAGQRAGHRLVVYRLGARGVGRRADRRNRDRDRRPDGRGPRGPRRSSASRLRGRQDDRGEDPRHADEAGPRPESRGSMPCTTPRRCAPRSASPASARPFDENLTGFENREMVSPPVTTCLVRRRATARASCSSASTSARPRGGP